MQAGSCGMRVELGQQMSAMAGTIQQKLIAQADEAACVIGFLHPFFKLTDSRFWFPIPFDACR
jgi:hypothetical protein